MDDKLESLKQGSYLVHAAERIAGAIDHLAMAVHQLQKPQQIESLADGIKNRLIDISKTGELERLKASWLGKKIALFGRLYDGSLDERASAKQVAKEVAAGAYGETTICVALHNSTEDMDRGGIVVVISGETLADGFLPHIVECEDGPPNTCTFELHVAGESEAEAFIDALVCALIKSKYTDRLKKRLLGWSDGEGVV